MELVASVAMVTTLFLLCPVLPEVFLMFLQHDALVLRNYWSSFKAELLLAVAAFHLLAKLIISSVNTVGK